MLFLDAENCLEHHARGRILVAEIADQFAVVIDCDPFGDVILADHVDERRAFGVLRGRTLRERLGIKVGRPAELVDALGNGHHVDLFFFCMLGEFGFDAFARDAVGRDGMHRVAQDAHDLGCEHGLQDLDRFVDVHSVGFGDVARGEVLARAIA